MTKAQFRKNFKSMLPDVRKNLLELAEKALCSGCLDLESEENNYRLPKMVLSAALSEQSFQYKPLYNNKQIDREIKNISMFI